MAQYVDEELVPKVKKVGLIINAFTKGGVIDEVTMGAALGDDALVGDNGLFSGASGYRPGSRVPVMVDIAALGELTTITIKKKTTHEVEVKFNALAFLDEPEKVDALNAGEKDQLANIGILELRARGAKAHGHEPPWTPFEDAVIAILAHDKGATYGEFVHLPQPGVAFDTAIVPGPVAGADIELSVGTTIFTENSSGFHAAISACSDGRTLYQYSWTGVPVTVLDEPTE